MRLSPSIRSGLLHTLACVINDEEPEEVHVYRCPVCTEDHDWKSDAEECCAEQKNIEVDHSSGHCPVCGEQFIDAESASDCCLWKDLPHAARQRIAAHVQAGALWSEAIAKEAQ